MNLELLQNPLWMSYALPVLVLLAGLELLLLRRRARRQPEAGLNYDWRETAASLAVALGQRLSGMLTALLIGPVYAAAWTLRLWEAPLDQVWTWALLFVGVEFIYYWQHRAGHEVRWFWASHSVHHSVTHYNLSAAYRLGWTAGLSGQALFYLPLAVLGFHPAAIFAMLGLNLLYQFGLHTTLVPKLGVLEAVLNTPSHHRVHHASNLEYLDANYGGVLIVFDRWFGTWRPERDDVVPVYGLVTPLRSHNPLVIALREWAWLLRDVRQAQGWRQRLHYLVKPPGWPGATTRDLRQQTAAPAQQATHSVATLSLTTTRSFS